MTGIAYTLRHYDPGDCEQAVALFGRAVHETTVADYTQQQRAAWAPDPPETELWRRRLSSGEVLVAEVDGRLLGFIRFAQVDARTGLVDLLFVLPEAQRQGIATALLERARDWAAQKQLASLVADVSLGARSFMERHGFTLLAEESVHRHGVALNRYRMQRTLAGQR